jgi:hypothetical protein
MVAEADSAIAVTWSAFCQRIIDLLHLNRLRNNSTQDYQFQVGSLA